MLEFDDVMLRQGAFALSADWQLTAGERAAIMGSSGAGKSTLLNAIAGFLPLDRGRILWDGRRIDRLHPAGRPVAMLFQDGNLFPHLDIAANIGLGLSPALRLTAAQREEVAYALDRVGLSGMGDRKPGDLSGGQQSRAALARVLVQGKPLLLLDEPFAALGPALRAEMLDLVAKVAARTGATLLMVSHAPEDAQRIANRLILVDEGRADPPLPLADTFAHPPEKLRRYLG